MRSLFVVVVLVALSVGAGPKKKPEAAAAPLAPSNALPTPLYVGFLASETESEEYKPLLEQADALVKAELAKYAIELAPVGESDDDSAKAAKAKQTTGVRVKLTLTQAREQMRAALLVTKIPGNALRGSWFVNASGPAPTELVDAIVPAIVADVAQDLGWQKRPAAP